jgi:hypothetical protein
MSWERDALWAKAVLFMGRATAEDRESDTFGLWAAMGLELLVRSAVSKVSPLLLADPERDQRNILHALGHGTGTPKSIATAQALLLCRTLIPEFTEEEFKAALALISRRNDELHTGEAAFTSFPIQSWIRGFYHCCKVLSEFQDESLETLFGADEAKAAEETLRRGEENTLAKVKASIAAHAKVFGGKDDAEKTRLIGEAEKQGQTLAHQGHHRVLCPACTSVATVQGDMFGGERIEHGDGMIIVRRSVVPTRFSCPACELKLSGYADLLAANVADHFTRRIEFTPEEYYELIDPNDQDQMRRYMRDYGEDHGFYEFNNE